MYKGDDGKTVYDVLDKDEKSVYRTSDSRLAMHYLSKNFNALRQGTAKPEMPAGWESKSLKEARTKVEDFVNKQWKTANVLSSQKKLTRITVLFKSLNDWINIKKSINSILRIKIEIY